MGSTTSSTAVGAATTKSGLEGGSKTTVEKSGGVVEVVPDFNDTYKYKPALYEPNEEMFEKLINFELGELKCDNLMTIDEINWFFMDKFVKLKMMYVTAMDKAFRHEIELTSNVSNVFDIIDDATETPDFEEIIVSRSENTSTLYRETPIFSKHKYIAYLVFKNIVYAFEQVYLLVTSEILEYAPIDYVTFDMNHALTAINMLPTAVDALSH